MIRTQNLKLPVGATPDWELNDEDGTGKPLKGIAESFVVLQSLKQSREKWLSGTFPKFSSKSRGGKPPDVIPQPHTIQTRGRCDLQIGLHTYPNTTFFEVHYLPIRPQFPPTFSSTFYSASSAGASSVTMPYSGYLPIQAQAPSSAGVSTSATMPYGVPKASVNPPPEPVAATASSSQTTPSVSTQKATASTSNATAKTPPLLSPTPSSVAITPALIGQVSVAASSNLTLAKLLQLAAAGKATPDELKSLGLLIQSLSGDNSSGSKPVPGSSNSTFPSSSGSLSPSYVSGSTSFLPSTSQQGFLPPVKEFDLVFEFHEATWERRTFPRGPVVCEQVSLTGLSALTTDILITTCIPFELKPSNSTNGGSAAATTEAPGNVTASESIPLQVVKFRLCRAPQTLWDTLYRWAGGEQGMAKSRKYLESLENPPRVYLGHRISEGALLTQLQNAAAPPYGMKSIKPLQPGLPRPRRKPAAPRKLPTEDFSSGAQNSAGATPPSTKKRKAVTTHNVSATKIACRSCGSTGVPLILGGRFCRPCVESGKVNTDIPSVGGDGLPAASIGSSTDFGQRLSVLTPKTLSTPAAGSG